MVGPVNLVSMHQNRDMKITIDSRSVILSSVLIGIILLIYNLWDVCVPLIIGAFLAYVLNPAVNMLVKSLHLKSRILPAFSIVVLIVAVTIAILEKIFPFLYQQFIAFYRTLETLDMQNLKTTAHNSLGQYISPSFILILESILSDMPHIILQFSSELLKDILHSTKTVINTALVTILTPFSTYYILCDTPFIKLKLSSVLQVHPILKELVTKLDDMFFKFLEGKMYECSLVAAMFSVTFLLLHLHFAVPIAILLGFLSFIPYVGTIIGFILITVLALVQFASIWHIILILLVFWVITAFDALVIIPKLVGNKLGLHPLAAVFSVVIGAKLSGIIGMFLALPAAALILILCKMCSDHFLLKEPNDVIQPEEACTRCCE